MSVALPDTKFLALSLSEAGVLTVTLNRPEVRNAMNVGMVDEVIALCEAVADRRDVRVLVLRGAGGHFCAGGDIRDMAQARSAPSEGGVDPARAMNRRFGAMMTAVDRAPQAVVAVLQGAVLGGGFGLACVADVAIAAADAKFGLPETGLGLPPAQIAPFVVRRVGLSQARRLAVTGGRLDGTAALAIGLVHAVAADEAGVEAELAKTLAQILRCAPGAVAATKDIVLRVGSVELEQLLDDAAGAFSTAVRGAEGTEGTMAFLQKRPASWVPQ